MATKNQNVSEDLCQGRVGREVRKTVAKKGVTAPRGLPKMEGGLRLLWSHFSHQSRRHALSAEVEDNGTWGSKLARAWGVQASTGSEEPQAVEGGPWAP